METSTDVKEMAEDFIVVCTDGLWGCGDISCHVKETGFLLYKQQETNGNS